MGLIIMVNFVVVIVETDHVAEDEGNTAPAWIEVSSWFVLGIFLVELILRLYVHQRDFWYDAWNTFDFVVVSVDTFFSIFYVFFGTLVPVSALRVLRLGKLARVSKAFRMFPELRLLMAGLIGSLRAIFWGTVLLAFALLIWSVIAVQFIHPLNKKLHETGAYPDCERCHRAYSSVLESCLTFFAQIVAGDSWGRETVPVIEAHPVTAVYFVMVFLSVGLAVLNLILGVVVNVAEQARENMRSEMDTEKLLTKMEEHSHLRQMCHDMDVDGSGELTKAELLQGYESQEEFRRVLNEMDIHEEDLEIVWTIMDTDKSGKISHDEFVTQVYRMKSSDQQFMLAYIKYYITIVKDKICERMDLIHQDVEQELGKDASFIVSEGEQLKIGSDSAEKIVEVQGEQNADAGLADDRLDATSPPDTTANVEARLTDLPPTFNSETQNQSARQTRTAPGGDVAVVHQSQVFTQLAEETRQRDTELMTAIKDMSSTLERYLAKSQPLTGEFFPPPIPRTDLLAVPAVPQPQGQPKALGLGPLGRCCRQNEAAGATMALPEARGVGRTDDQVIVGSAPQQSSMPRLWNVGSDMRTGSGRAMAN